MPLNIEENQKDHTGENQKLRARIAELEHQLSLSRGAEEDERTNYGAYRSLVENIRDYVYTLTKEGYFKALSPSFEAVTGWTPKEWIGRHFEPLVHPDDLAKAHSNLQRALEDDTPPVNELRIRTKSGEYVTLEFKGKPIRNSRGEDEIFGVARDVTERKNLEQERNMAFRLFHGTLDSSPLAIVVADRDRKVRFWNKAAERTFGWTELEVAGHPIPIVPPHKGEEFALLDNSLASGESFVGIETERMRKDGTCLQVSLSLAPLKSPEGRVTHIVSVFADITERKLVAAALQESEERYRRLVDSAPDPIVVSSDMTIKYANKAAVAASGARSPENMVGRNVLDFVHPEFRDTVRQRMIFIESTGQPVASMEQKHITLDGRTLETEVSSTPVIFKGKPAVQSILRDVSARKRAEAALRESEERFRRLVDSAPEPIVVHIDGIIVYANKTAVETSMAKSAEEFLGKNIRDFIHPDSRQAMLNMLERLEKGEIPAREIHRYYRLDGFIADLEVSASPIMYHGKPAVITLARDVTQRKREEEELRRAKDQAEDATRLKDKFVTMVSHDLRSPLSSVMGFLKLIVSDPAMHLNPRQVATFQRTFSNCNLMINLIDRLLNVGRLQSGMISLKKEFADARMFVQSSIVGLLHLAEEKKIAVANEIPPGHRIYADRDLLQQVVINLVSNAIKFCKEGDAITIYSPPGKPSAIAVRDTGLGIPPDRMEKLFRADVKTTTVGTAGEIGTGLGLPFCKEIMDTHGGAIKVESEDGKGSTFRVELPPVRPLALVVDDSAEDRFILRSYLERMDMEVVEAENGEVALAKLGAAKPHIAIVDVLMPVMGGVELLVKIKENPAATELPVIVITSSTDLEVRKTAFRVGISDFINKPIDEQDFTARVRKYVM
ncbi:MAG: PAS domain S-box protein [Nitrospinae bacterium]|nr:PAS domain S-box protein [Nitrospinota bacterium]